VPDSARLQSDNRVNFVSTPDQGELLGGELCGVHVCLDTAAAQIRLLA